jgi:hypothetical protein
MPARSQDRRVRPVAEQAPDPRPRGRGRARGRVAPAAATALLRRHRSRHRRGPARHVDAGAAATPPRRDHRRDRRRTNRRARTRTCAWRGDDTGAARRRRRPGSRTGSADRVAAHRLVRGDPVDGTRRRCGAPPRPSHRGRLARWSRHDMAPMSPSAPDSGTPRPQLTASDVSPTDSVSIRPVLAAERGGRITT